MATVTIEPALTIVYTNWRGETAERQILPRRCWYGSTEWHPEPQWLLKAWDVEKQAERDFAWNGIDFQGDGPGLTQARAEGKAEGMRWRTDVEDGVHACHVEAARFDHDVGEWVVGIILAPPGKPWTHWRHLGPMPDASLHAQTAVDIYATQQLAGVDRAIPAENQIARIAALCLKMSFAIETLDPGLNQRVLQAELSKMAGEP